MEGDINISTLIECGHLHLYVNDEGFTPHVVLSYLNGKPGLSKYRAAFTWIMDKVEDVSDFILSNPQYAETYMLWKRISQLSHDEKAAILKEDLPMYNTSTSGDMEDIKYLRFENIPCSPESIKRLLEYIETWDTTSYHHSLQCKSISKWIEPIKSTKDVSNSDVISILEFIGDPDVEAIKTYGCLYPYRSNVVEWFSYLLGYPIHAMSKMEHITGNKSILVSRLNAKGAIDSVCTRTKMYTLRRINETSRMEEDGLISSNISSSSFGGTILSADELERIYNDNIINPTDSIGLDAIALFSPFDVVRYRHPSGKICQLTRREYDYVKSTGKNPWTTDTVPTEVITELHTRVILAKLYNLPECKPLDSVLRNILPTR